MSDGYRVTTNLQLQSGVLANGLRRYRRLGACLCTLAIPYTLFLAPYLHSSSRVLQRERVGHALCPRVYVRMCTCANTLVRIYVTAYFSLLITDYS